MEPYLGEIKIFAGSFAPSGWFFCDGTTLAISQYSALFSLLGTTYGGDGMQTFNLPDLRGRTPIHAGNGQGRGVSKYVQGQIGGVENVTLTVQQMPAHTHVINAVSTDGTALTPTGAYPATSPGDPLTGAGVNIYSTATPDVTMNNGTLTPAGGSQPVNVVTPYLGINYIIAWQGIYPSRP
ncbi:phage tail protein [Mucilaginibacter sp. 14171R-50]|uniref:phage tail protein n=1 Tax=Mucilaginibacter sp. 14171R-50 TaxID=2703789 RepID=UPI00138B8E31|nr:tail fiber protein [Mucilaginibacter sp. 14171R-50]QHS55837.1 phage tail protein [Mucilaginibacter sp. 14171R-50]